MLIMNTTTQSWKSTCHQFLSTKIWVLLSKQKVRNKNVNNKTQHNAAFAAANKCKRMTKSYTP